jgi:DNA (cytosine-5)-methyltransferase 1
VTALDLFAGPGGWDHGLRELDITPLGIEWDDAACATREAAGHRTLQADVAALDPLEFAPCELLIASPPCQAFSAAGKGDGHRDVELILYAARWLAKDRDRRADVLPTLADPRSLLVVEPLRWALALRPNHIALEQVPPVLALWKVFAEALRDVGYHCWAGCLRAEAYGVPQTRERAILMASLAGPVSPPLPTHQTYEPGVPAQELHTLEGSLLPWVSMAEALGWGMTERPVGTIAAGGSRQGGPDPLDGGSGARAMLRRESEAGRWIVGQARSSGPGAARPPRALDEPSYTLRANAGGGSEGVGRSGGIEWVVRTNNFTAKNYRGERGVLYERDIDAPAPTLGTQADQWEVGPSRHGCDDPLELKGDDWPERRPATTVAGDPRVFQPGGHHGKGEQSQNAVRVTLEEAAILQGFPPDYPFQGSRTKQFEQVGNAVPPPLALAIVRALVGDSLRAAA